VTRPDLPPTSRSKAAFALSRLALTIAALSLAAAVPAQSSPEPQPASGTVSPAQYQARLQSLDQLLSTCQHAMTPANCQSDPVGPDIKVELPSGPRQVRFAWLRELLNQASKGQTNQAANGQTAKTEDQKHPESIPHKPDFTPPTLAQQLQDARQRLAAEEKAVSVGQSPSPRVTRLRQALTQILAAKEYHAAVARPSLLHQLLEKIDNWLARLFANLRKAGFKSRWIGLTAEIGFMIFVCVALAWFLIRLERRGRLGIAGLHPELITSAASARDWQLWLADAQKAAAQSAWRDAIPYLYWASISRMESSGLWPADRARTPREYLALLSHKSVERTDLAALTRSFERTWYARRSAAEADFLQAEKMAAHLGARTGAALPASRPAAGMEAQ
jgi:hypothetical protein